MALTINTNISSLVAQRNLNNATNSLNKAIERLTTGYTINHASDNAAGYSISKMWVTQLGSLDVAADNAATGADMLTTAEETYGLLTDHLQRIRDLTEQAANGTYGSQSLKAIQSEIAARLEEINRISANAEFNGIKLMAYTGDGDGSGITSTGLNLQVGLYADADSRIKLDVSLFKDASICGLFSGMNGLKSESGEFFSALIDGAGGAHGSLNSSIEAFAAACSGLKIDTAHNNVLVLQDSSTKQAKEMIKFLDDAINEISGRVTKIGSAQNRIVSALSSLDVQSQNITSSLSTLRDTDVAKESSNYLQAQILQQASATLLSTANQLPSVALNLL